MCAWWLFSQNINIRDWISSECVLYVRKTIKSNSHLNRWLCKIVMTILCRYHTQTHDMTVRWPKHFVFNYSNRKRHKESFRLFKALCVGIRVSRSIFIRVILHNSMDEHLSVSPFLSMHLTLLAVALCCGFY